MITINEYRFSMTSKPSEGTVRVDTFRVSSGNAVGDWVVLNLDGSVNRSGRHLPNADAMAEMRLALREYLGTAVPSASYSLDQVVQALPAAPLASLGDDALLAEIQARTGVHQTALMRRYILREARYHLGRGADLSDADLRTIVQDACEWAAHRE